ncbi:MAG TPA: S1C family serine protease [Burkholderiaceae bacterium]|nr:S1C family serine protease [Burkholderiaceae bacterium]
MRSRPRPSVHPARRWMRCAVAIIALIGFCTVAAAADRPASASVEQAQAKALGRASDAVVGVRVMAVDDARSKDTLGRVRQGSGVVIGGDDLVLTIGYLVVEAEQVQLLLDDGRTLPARVVAYDQATGFGLVQSLAPTHLEPVPLGSAASVQGDEPLMVVTGGEDGGISLARMVSQRPFSGYWEYHIDGALFTAPARTDQSGAALFNARGELLGIGSLLVTDALGPDAPRLPGNMFVPIDLLKPILNELRAAGMSAESRRAWMGVSCVEHGGAVRVVRVSDDSPAQEAGLRPGDQILRLDGNDVGDLSALWKALWHGQPERDVTLEIRRGEEPRQVRMHTIDRNKTFRHAQGI